MAFQLYGKIFFKRRVRIWTSSGAHIEPKRISLEESFTNFANWSELEYGVIKETSHKNKCFNVKLYYHFQMFFNIGAFRLKIFENPTAEPIQH